MSLTIYDLIYEGDHSELYSIILGPTADYDKGKIFVFLKY